jgi:glycine C-acetyltransferase
MSASGPSSVLTKRIGRELGKLKSAGTYHEARVLECGQRAQAIVTGCPVVNLSSNNYLGFADHPYLKQRARQFLEQWGAGTGAVRHIAGTFTIHEELERKLADFKQAETTTVFQSGFATNQGVLGALLREGDLVVSDELNHASIIDGLRLTKATRAIFRHADVDDLDRVITRQRPDGLALIVTDGVFSMDGDIAPLDRIIAVARRHGAVVYVDDAHGSGVLGRSGRGTVDHFGLYAEPDIIQVGTLSKAWGVVGGYAVGPLGFDKLLRNAARPLVYSTSHPPAVVGAAIAALELVDRSPEIIEKLWANTHHFRGQLQALGFDTMRSETPIVPVRFGTAKLARLASEMLFAEGIFAVPIGHPVVPEGSARIRNIVTAEHDTDSLDQALAAYRKVGQALAII